MDSRDKITLSMAFMVAVLASCTGIPTEGERAARKDLRTVSEVFQPGSTEPHPPTLAKDSTLGDYLRFSMLNQPLVAAAYHDWSASIERITVERSLPDPKLTFQAYIQNMLTSLMPGLMQEFPWPDKLKAAADVADAVSKSKYFVFETVVLQTAFSLKRAYYQLGFLDEKIRINNEALHLLTELEKSARAQNEAGQMTLQDVRNAQAQRDRLANDIANLEDSRHSLMAQFKGALGLTRDKPDPPWPSMIESTPPDLQGGELLETAFARNPRLKAMEAEVRMAEASLVLARKAKLPDFSAGLMAEVYSPPFYWPLGSMSLPIWRDKIVARIAAAQADKQVAEARLTAEQIEVGVDFAMKTYDYRETTRGLALLEEKLIPKARQSFEIARAAYVVGEKDFFNLMDAERTLLNFQLEEVEIRTRREIVLADLSLSIAGVAPEGAPILPPSSNTQ